MKTRFSLFINIHQHPAINIFESYITVINIHNGLFFTRNLWIYREKHFPFSLIIFR